MLRRSCPRRQHGRRPAVPADGHVHLGVTFDGQPNPLVLESFDDIRRVNVANAAVVGTIPLPPIDDGSRRSLEYRPSTNTFFTTHVETPPFANTQDVLYSVSPSGVETLIGSTNGFFNFLSLAVDPSDNLWLLSDTVQGDPFHPDGALYSVNKSTGVATLATRLTGLEFDQVHALGVDEAGHFFASTHSSIYQINP
jgi:hypothetical protein